MIDWLFEVFGADNYVDLNTNMLVFFGVLAALLPFTTIILHPFITNEQSEKLLTIIRRLTFVPFMATVLIMVVLAFVVGIWDTFGDLPPMLTPSHLK